eukprot:jgi/Tetstr1/463490/TSEL_008381.t1
MLVTRSSCCSRKEKVAPHATPALRWEARGLPRAGSDGLGGAGAARGEVLLDGVLGLGDALFENALRRVCGELRLGAIAIKRFELPHVGGVVGVGRWGDEDLELAEQLV